MPFAADQTYLLSTLSLSASLLFILVVRKSKNTLQMSKQAKYPSCVGCQFKDEKA